VTGAWGVVGHERAVDLFRRVIANGRMGHAYLLSGPRGVGKRTLALALARAVNCERYGPGVAPTGVSADRNASMEAPCGQCRHCRLIAAGTHSEVRSIAIQPPHRVIRVADIEAIQADAALRASDVYRKVYIIEQAELLHPDAANRLLKTIEEPPPSVMMILTTVDPEATIETIVSRCQPVRLRPLGRDRLAEYLEEKHALEGEQAALIAALAERCVGRAETMLANRKLLERRDDQLDELGRLLHGDRLERLAYARILGDRWSRDPDSVREVLDTWLRWCRDVLLVQGGFGQRITNVDRRADVERQAQALTRDEIGAAVTSLRDALQMLDQNVNARLTLDVAALDLPRLDRAA
jgi:DNA polymerase-3 subunit delta'